MYKQLFFDDQRLYLRENTRRIYGTPEWIGHYVDKNVNTSYGWGWAIKGLDDKIHLLYMGTRPNSDKALEHLFLAAISDDGIHFEPRNTACEAGFANPACPNQLLPSDNSGSEIANIVLDEHGPASERYKILYSDNTTLFEDLHVEDYILASPDLIHWRKLRNSCWNPYGTEPFLGAFYNDVAGKFTILSRPNWGQRRVGITDTSDWHYFTPLELCMQCDSLDPELAEVYGMTAIAYDGWFIGFPHIYANMPHTRDTKFLGGTMHCELAYSLNGHHWQRSLRTPFIDRADPAIVSQFGREAKMTYLGSALRLNDGSLLLYVATNTREHGTNPAEIAPGETGMEIFRLREDGFIALTTDNPAEESIVATRDALWQGGELTVNLQAEAATCALYSHEEGEPKIISGFGHDDCVPFSGDAPRWQPQWQGGSMQQFAGKVLVLEVKFRNGTLYSLSGDAIPLMNSEHARFARFGILPARKGF